MLKILSFEKINDRLNIPNYYFEVSTKKNEYSCSIKIFNKKIIESRCSCAWGMFAFAESKNPIKICRHVNLCIKYLRKEGLHEI